ncbi:MAG: ABC transporter permease [Prolixibacteraceae bacterium]|nr:ABC transporter permease [Prolixibacteraceae bacterium]
MNLTNLKISIRSLLKNKIQSSISVLGLGIGLGSIMLLVILVIHEFSFDKFIPDYNSAFRVIQGDDCRTPYLLAEEIKNEIPEVKSFFRFFQANNVQIKDKNGQILSENLFAFADSSVYNNLGIKFRYGTPALSRNEVALSESMAKKYYKYENASGSLLIVKFNDDFITLTVSGVYEDFPSNSTLNPEFIADLELSGEVFGQTQRMLGEYGSSLNEFKTWDRNYFYTYLFLNEGSDSESVTNKIQKYAELLDQERWADAGYSLQPVSEIYFNSNELNGNLFSRTGNKDELKYYMAIAFVILCISVINYIFLTKAKIIIRLKELGAKKAMGATRFIIQKQVLFEAILIASMSVIPAFIIIIPGISFINSTLNKTIGSEVFSLGQTWLSLILVIVLTGTFSGLLIGSNISRISIVQLLTGRMKKIGRKNNLKNSFLSFHFAVFIILIVSVLTFKKQINYALTNFKAINPENILICNLGTAELQKQFPVIKNELEKNPGVKMIAGSSFIPPFNAFLPINLKTEDGSVRFDGLIMGEGMIELLEMEVVDGESFGVFQQGVTTIIINESAAKEFNIKAGELLNGFKVRGIVRDFSAHSIHSLIQPMAILQQNPEKMRLMAVKTNGVNDASVISDLQKMVRQISPEAFIDINYLTDNINQFYTREQNQAKLIGVFSVLAIVLSVMGLFGVVLISITRRTKEIGIRKVNGAKIFEVLTLLNKDFLIWVIIAYVIAVPVSYYTMTRWLENFAYQVGLSWWIFIIAGVLAFFIALMTVTFQSFKVAKSNPVEALRYE